MASFAVQSQCMFFAEYSLLAMFDTYPASKCTTQNMYTCVCAGLVVIVSLRTALGSLKEERKKEDEEDEQFAWATISVYQFRNVCQPRYRYLSAQKNRLIIPRWLKCRETPRQRKIYRASLRIAILICDVEQVISATLMDSSEALTPKIKAGMVNSR